MRKQKKERKSLYKKYPKPSCFLTQCDHFTLQNPSPAMAKMYEGKLIELTLLLHICSSQHLLWKSWVKTHLDLPIQHLPMKLYFTKVLYLLLLPLTIKASTAFHALQYKFYSYLLHWKEISNHFFVLNRCMATSHMRNKNNCILLNFYANCSSLAVAFYPSTHSPQAEEILFTWVFFKRPPLCVPDYRACLNSLGSIQDMGAPCNHYML